MKNNSESEVIKEYIIQIMADGKVHTRKELHTLVEEKFDFYTYGKTQGVINRLIDNGMDYRRVTDGKFQYIGQNDVMAVCTFIFEETVDKLNALSTNPFSLCNILDDDKMKKLKKVKECIKVIEDTLVELRGEESERV